MFKEYSRSPFGEEYEIVVDEAQQERRIDEITDNQRSTVVIQGLGFVGAAMAAALMQTRGEDGELLYNVIAVDLADAGNFWKIARAREGKAPVLSSDASLEAAYRESPAQGNFYASYSSYAYTKADVLIVDINLDIKKKALGQSREYDFSLSHYLNALEPVAHRIGQDTLLIIETTVPPGCTDGYVRPLFQRVFKERGLDPEGLCLVHSYERVMPGKEYLKSITSFYRVFAGINSESASRGRRFFQSFIDTKNYPLSELHSTNASEMAKVLENSFRAMNIAFIKEWSDYAQRAEVDLFEVIEAIRQRPTHRNIMYPGFGVGGYCLTKDSLLADWSYRELFHGSGQLEMSLEAVSVNDLMPKDTLALIQGILGDIRGLGLMIFGVSYTKDVADTRCSPTELFYDLCLQAGARVGLHDPLVREWTEKDMTVEQALSEGTSFECDVAVFTVKHREYLHLSAQRILEMLPRARLIVDANDVLDDQRALELYQGGVAVAGIGKGHWHYEKVGANDG